MRVPLFLSRLFCAISPIARLVYKICEGIRPATQLDRAAWVVRQASCYDSNDRCVSTGYLYINIYIYIYIYIYMHVCVFTFRPNVHTFG